MAAGRDTAACPLQRLADALGWCPADLCHLLQAEVCLYMRYTWHSALHRTCTCAAALAYQKGLQINQGCRNLRNRLANSTPLCRCCLRQTTVYDDDLTEPFMAAAATLLQPHTCCTDKKCSICSKSWPRQTACSRSGGGGSGSGGGGAGSRKRMYVALEKRCSSRNFYLRAKRPCSADMLMPCVAYHMRRLKSSFARMNVL